MRWRPSVPPEKRWHWRHRPRVKQFSWRSENAGKVARRSDRCIQRLSLAALDISGFAKNVHFRTPFQNLCYYELLYSSPLSPVSPFVGSTSLKLKKKSSLSDLILNNRPPAAKQPRRIL